jgi:hypothetical protein
MNHLNFSSLAHAQSNLFRTPIISLDRADMTFCDFDDMNVCREISTPTLRFYPPSYLRTFLQLIDLGVVLITGTIVAALLEQ